jgi:alpha-tubulin suppressor-like RCC1 family protein
VSPASYDFWIVRDVVADARGARSRSLGSSTPAPAVRLLAIGSCGLALIGLGAGIAPGAGASTPTAISISATVGHTCAAMSGGAVECWGKSYLPKTKSKVPVPVKGISGAVAVEASPRSNCVLLASHHVLCWGDDGFGQLGNGHTQDSGRPVEVVGISTAVAISAGRLHACALLAGGTVTCWGRNAQGALGDGSLRNSSTPVTVRGITDAVAISAGQLGDTTCAVLAGGEVRCWGNDLYGQLGDGTTNSSDVPVGVTSISDAVAISTSGQHACAVLAGGGVACWGRNNRGQLGNGTRQGSGTPVHVSGITAATGVAAAPYGYTCAVVRSGSVYCWGPNPKNQLGDGLYPAGSTVPVRAVGITNAVAVTAGMGHACALLADGGADCWGYNDYGQLGKGAGPPRISNPVLVRFGSPAAPARPEGARRPPTRHHQKSR